MNPLNSVNTSVNFFVHVNDNRTMVLLFLQKFAHSDKIMLAMTDKTASECNLDENNEIEKMHSTNFCGPSGS